MLEKSEGAVVCAHCQRLGADTSCPFCHRSVCKKCLGPVGCPVPHPEALRLGTGRRLRDVDVAGRYGRVAKVLSEAEDIVELRTGVSLDWPLHRYRIYSLETFGPATFNGGFLVRPVWSYEMVGDGAEAEKRYRDCLLAVAEVFEGHVMPTRFFERNDGRQRLDANVRLTDDAKLAVIFSASRVDFSTLDGTRAPRSIDLHGELIQSWAFSARANLLAIGVFGRMRLYHLGQAYRLAEIAVEAEDVVAVGVGAGRAVAVSAEGQLMLAKRKGKGRYVESELEKLPIKGALRPDELSLSEDGRLLAFRSKQKAVIVRNLDDGSEQTLPGHTDRVSFVRFVNAGQLLVTADDDNRVWLWPRQGDRLISGA